MREELKTHYKKEAKLNFRENELLIWNLTPFIGNKKSPINSTFE